MTTLAFGYFFLIFFSHESLNCQGMDSAIDSALFLQPSSNCCHLLLSASALHFDEFAVFEISERLSQRLWENSPACTTLSSHETMNKYMNRHENTSRYFWYMAVARAESCNFAFDNGNSATRQLASMVM